MSDFRALQRIVAVLVAFAAVLIFSASAWAGVGWHVTSTVYPTDLSPTAVYQTFFGPRKGAIEVKVQNIGDTLSSGPITVTDVLPEGVTATEAGGIQIPFVQGIGEEGFWNCSGVGTRVVTCVSNPENLPSIPDRFAEEEEAGTGTIAYLGLALSVAPGTTGTLDNRVTVTGGGAAQPGSFTEPITFSSQPAGFGIQNASVWTSNANGEVDTQAGSHPYEYGFNFEWNTDFNGGVQTAGGEVRNLEVRLPPGLVGNVTAVPRCTREEFDASGGTCPPSTQIGLDSISYYTGYIGFPAHLSSFPVFNMVPPPGVAAQFAFTILGIETFLDSTVRSGGDYGITTHIDNIPQKELVGNQIVFWGEPANPVHDAEREGHGSGASNGEPFFTLGSACEGAQAQEYGASTVAWGSENTTQTAFFEDEAAGVPTGLTGCQDLAFGPAITISPDTSAADTPAGLTSDVKVNQEGLVTNEALAPSSLREATVTLPEGLVLNPDRAAGLQACSLAQSGLGSGEASGDEGPPSCPLASQVGTVQISTPLLFNKLEGAVYLLESEPPNVKLEIAASGEGVNVKLEGTVSENEQTGRMVARFPEDPPVPFTDFKLQFTGGAQAALATPTRCGVYTTSVDFKPWASPFVEDALGSNSFGVESGTEHAACPSGALPFTPTLIAGATTDQAGGYTDFSLLLRRPDDQQRIDGLQFKAPEGLTGLLAKVPLCTNVQAEANACPEASKIGHTVIESGPGPYPLVVPEPGQEPAPIYLTESYDGAPFGLAIVVPLHVGPFVLPTQRVRAKIEVNPITSALTVTTNPFPQEVAGVPTDLREVDAVIERPEFMINPSNCEAMSFSGTAYGTAPPGVNEPNTNAAIGSHFQVGSCRSLEFHPQLAVSTSSRSSRANGTSVSFKLSYPKGAVGKESWLKELKVDLPKQLPARLSTLQKSCPAATFNANPATCPAASRIGTARVRTELLPVPLEGPVYFVSNGGSKFPEAVFAIQGDGVSVDIHAETFINEKTGVTSATFHAIPDDPFEEATVTLPSGPYSEFTATGNLCKDALKMPTAFVGQNGAEIRQNTKISVTGCPKSKKAKKAKKSKKKGKHKKK